MVGTEGAIIISEPLWGLEMWENIWVLLQEPEAVLTVFRVPAHNNP